MKPKTVIIFIQGEESMHTHWLEGTDVSMHEESSEEFQLHKHDISIGSEGSEEMVCYALFVLPCF